MSDQLLPPVNGTDQRLDAILDELRGLRADLERAPVAVRQRVDRLTHEVSALADGETVELREPDPSTRPRKRK